MTRYGSKILIIIILLLIVAGAAAIYRTYNQPAEDPAIASREGESLMKITSSAFSNDKMIPAKYTCDSEGINPPLNLMDVPDEAKSLALTVEDPDAPSGTFVHWTMWNIPAETREIAENSVPSGAVQGRTGTGRSVYVGPCPPSGTHHYIFTVFALDSELDLPAGSDIADLKQAMEGHVLDSAELIGLYVKQT